MRKLTKQKAIKLLGGTTGSAAKAIGISSQAISQWPDDLTPGLIDRVEAAQFRLTAVSIVTKTRSTRAIKDYVKNTSTKGVTA